MTTLLTDPVNDGSALNGGLKSLRETADMAKVILDVMDDVASELDLDKSDVQNKIRGLLVLAQEKIVATRDHIDTCLSLERSAREVDRRALAHPNIVDAEASKLQSSLRDFDLSSLAVVKGLLDAPAKSQELIGFWLDGKLMSDARGSANSTVANRVVRRPKKSKARRK